MYNYVLTSEDLITVDGTKCRTRRSSRDINCMSPLGGVRERGRERDGEREREREREVLRVGEEQERYILYVSINTYNTCPLVCHAHTSILP